MADGFTGFMGWLGVFDGSGTGVCGGGTFRHAESTAAQARTAATHRIRRMGSEWGRAGPLAPRRAPDSRVGEDPTACANGKSFT